MNDSVLRKLTTDHNKAARVDAVPGSTADKHLVLHRASAAEEDLVLHRVSAAGKNLVLKQARHIMER